MKLTTAVSIVLCTAASCSSQSILKMPEVPNPPPSWDRFSTERVQASDCPELEGVYSEPPLVFRSGKAKRFVPSDLTNLYSSYIPFHLGDRSVLQTDAVDFLVGSFVLKQPDPTQFFMVYKNKPTDEIVQLHFLQSDGDFVCSDGTIRFPDYQVNGMIEGASLNFQIRNILVKDLAGALVIQSTRGPYRADENDLNNEFSYEFIRYPSIKLD